MELTLTSLFALAAAAPAIVEDVITSFGNLTLAGYGGVPVAGTSIVSGDISGHWQISGGKISPSAAGDTADLNAGPYSLVLDNGQTVDITININEYSSSATEAEISGSLDDLSAEGKTVKVRSGVLSNPGSDIFRGYAFTADTFVEGEPGFIVSLGAGHVGLQLFNSSFLWLKNFEVSADGNASTVAAVVVKGSGVNNSGLDGLVVHGAYRDPLGDYSSGNYSNTLDAVVCQSSGGWPTSLTVKNCTVYDVETGLNISCNGAVTVEDNEIYHTYSDSAKINIPTGAIGTLTAGTKFNRNVIYDFLGDPADVGNPHIDALQLLDVTAQGDWTNFECHQNVVFQTSNARGRSLQGLVNFSGSPTAMMINPSIKGNVVLLDSVHGITMSYINGGEVVGNTCVTFDTSLTTYTTGINLGTGGNGAGLVNLFGNITEALDLNLVPVDNVSNLELGSQGATYPYNTVFEGSSGVFDATTFSQVLAQYSIKMNGPADIDNSGTPTVGDSGTIGTGYSTFGNVKDNGVGWSLDPAYEALGVYSQNLVTFDGTSDYVFSSAAQYSNGPKLTFSAWLNPSDTSGFRQFFKVGGRVDIRGNGSNINVIIKDTLNATLINVTTVGGNYALGSNNHVHVVCDLGATDAAGDERLKITVNGITEAFNIASVGTGLIEYNSDHGYLGTNTGDSLYAGTVGDLYSNFSEALPYTDFQDGANNPVDISSFATADDIYMGGTMVAADWNSSTNLGTKTVVMNGSVT